jgi:transketolase
MGAIMNGIAVSDMLIPYGATFFCFSDYMRPAIRLAALSRYPTIFVFTHDSIGLGEDGPTHQAVEHIAALRAIPGLVVLRPADANETAFAWKFALENRTSPTAILLTRQKLPVLDQQKLAPASNLYRGGYVVKTKDPADVILIGTGSEVHVALAAEAKLAAAGIRCRVVSMPSWELFERQSPGYRESVLPSSIRARVGVEAGIGLGWERYLSPSGAFVGMTTYGASAPGPVLFEKFNITAERVAGEATRLIGRNPGKRS